MKNTIFALNTVHKQVAAMLIATILMWAVGAPLWMVSRAHAGQLLSVSDVISDSDDGVLANHTITFTTSATGQLAAGENFVVTFPVGFVFNASMDEGDVDMTVGGGEQSLAAGAAPGVWGVVVNDTLRTVTFTSNNTTIGPSTQVIIELGTHADGGTYQITNPSPGAADGIGTSYLITIDGSMDDSGSTRVAIISDVTMTAAVDTILTFNIYGTASSTDVNGVTTYASSTATSMAFGTLGAGEAKALGQRLEVSTNAINGFSVTVAQDQNLLSASGADIDLFVEGDATSTAIAWQAPVANVSDENTWGHYGITSEDVDLSGGDVFGDALFRGDFASSTPLEIFYHDGPASGTTTEVAVQIEINNLQEAANDYSNTLTYVCTPVF